MYQNHQFKLANFEGPLDLLLHLVREKKVDLFNIDLLDLINQYVKLVQNFNNENLEYASSYLVMATYLLEIKSKLLLPKSEVIVEGDDDFGKSLIANVLLYGQFKELGQHLNKRSEERLMYFDKSFDPLIPITHKKIQGEYSINDLANALKEMKKRIE